MLWQAKIIQETGEYLGRTIAIMVNLFNPEKILLAGEVVEADKILFPAIRRCVEQQSLPSFHQNLPIERAYFQGQHTMGGVAPDQTSLARGRPITTHHGNVTPKPENK